MIWAKWFLTLAMLTFAGCASDGSNVNGGVAAPTSNPAEITTTTVASVSPTQPSTTTAQTSAPAEVEPCEEFLGEFGVEIHPTERVGPFYDPGGTNHRCVVVGSAARTWMVTVTVPAEDEPWTNARMADRYDPDYFVIEQRVEISDTDGIWFEVDTPTCRTRNGQQICDRPNPDSEIKNSYLVCNGLIYQIGGYVVGGAETASAPAIEDYRRIQGEVFSAVCPTYSLGAGEA